MKEPFNNLRCGFKYSLIALILLCLLVFLTAFPIVGIFILVLPFVVTFVWCYGLIKRYKAWKSLGQTNITYAILIGGVLIVAFINPLYPLYLLLSILLPFVSPVILILISPVSWMSYTFLESQGLKKLKQKYGIDLSHSRTLSLAAILLFIVVYFFLLLLFYSGSMDYSITFYNKYSIGLLFWLYVFFGMIPIPFLLSIPFLIASCILAMKSLKHSEYLKPHPVIH